MYIFNFFSKNDQTQLERYGSSILFMNNKLMSRSIVLNNGISKPFHCPVSYERVYGLRLYKVFYQCFKLNFITVKEAIQYGY